MFHLTIVFLIHENNYGGTLDVMGIVVRNGLADTSSNPRRG